MNEAQTTGLLERYLAALRNHFEHGSRKSLQASHQLGRDALELGLETLDVARIHEHALVTLLSSDLSPAIRDELNGRAAMFFAEAVTPIEETHRIALETSADVDQLNSKLGQRTLDLAKSKRDLQRQIARRTRAQTALGKSERASGKLLKDSRELEMDLHTMNRRILTATETGRKKMSHQLNDEIAQSLLGIHVRMLTLKKEVELSATNVSQEIATTQRLVEDSAETINRLVHEFSILHE